MFVYNYKVMKTGQHTKIVFYEEPVAKGFQQRSRSSGQAYHLGEDEEYYHIDNDTGEMIPAGDYEESKKLHNRKLSTHRARNQLIDIINNNFGENDKFLTLTIAEQTKDIDKAKRYMNKFFKKIREKYPDLKYAYVIEFHKSGAIHFHAIMNTPYIKAKEIERLWGKGIIKINRISHVKNVGAYVVKYMTKDGVDARLIGRKLYQTSQNCTKPTWEYYKKLPEQLEELWKDDKKITFSSSYLTERNGRAIHKEIKGEG